MGFPTDIQVAEYFGVAYDNLSTTLTQPLYSADTTAYVSSTDNFPSSGWITVEDDIRSYTGKTSSSFTGLIGSIGGTTPADHIAGKAVSLTLNSVMWNRVVEELRAIMTALGASLANIATLTNSVTLTNKTLTKPVINAHYDTPQTYTPDAAGTATLNLALSNEHKITMPAGNITIAISNASVGQKFVVEITQDDVGSRTVTWFSTIRWADGSAPTLTTTANKRDVFGFIVTGSGTYDGFVVGQNI